MSNWQSSPGQFQPYTPPSGGSFYDRRPSSPSLTWLWVVLGVGGIAILCCCGGVIGLAVFGMNIVAEEVADQVRDNPKFREHIGELQEITFDFAASAAKDEQDTFVYTVKGDKGSGTLIVKETTDAIGNDIIAEATLRLPDGRQVQIVP